MKKGSFLIIAIIFFIAMVNVAFAGNASVTQDVTFTVESISAIAITGAPVLTITQSATSPGDTDPSVTSTGNYSLWTNKNGQKITGAITTGGNMPTGLTLEVEMAATGVGTSTGKKTLTTSAVDLVTGITKKKGTGLVLTYTLTADPLADPVSNETRTITYTVTQ